MKAMTHTEQVTKSMKGVNLHRSLGYVGIGSGPALSLIPAGPDVLLATLPAGNPPGTCGQGLAGPSTRQSTRPGPDGPSAPMETPPRNW
jgi:hypothetical protein